MKYIFRTILSILAVLVIFSGCSKIASLSPYNMKATIGSTSYDAPYCIATAAGNYTAIEGTQSITSITYPYIALELLNYNKTTGNFVIDTTNLTVNAIYYTSSSSPVLAQSGTISITATSPNITGTFTLTMKDGTSISNGTFTAYSN